MLSIEGEIAILETGVNTSLRVAGGVQMARGELIQGDPQVGHVSSTEEVQSYSHTRSPNPLVPFDPLGFPPFLCFLVAGGTV